MSLEKLFGIKDKVCVITGAAGLLAKAHISAVLEGGGVPVLLDINQNALEQRLYWIKSEYPEHSFEYFVADINNKQQLEKIGLDLLKKYGHVDALINNVANNPKVESKTDNMIFNSFCDFPLDIWEKDIRVGLTGTFIVTQVFCKIFEKQKSGIIINISSDYGLIAPDQRVYEVAGKSPDEQIKKPATYSVLKHALIGFTKYLAAYYANLGIRVNTLCPASIFNNQNAEFVAKVSKLIPLGRMSEVDEYVSTILYMLSSSCSYMTGATIVLDGGRTII